MLWVVGPPPVPRWPLPLPRWPLMPPGRGGAGDGGMKGDERGRTKGEVIPVLFAAVALL